MPEIVQKSTLLTETSMWGDLGDITDEETLEAYLRCWINTGLIAKTSDSLILEDVPLLTSRKKIIFFFAIIRLARGCSSVG